MEVVYRPRGGLDPETRCQKFANPLTSIAVDSSQIRELKLDLQKTDTERDWNCDAPPEAPSSVSLSALLVRDPEQRDKAGETCSGAI